MLAVRLRHGIAWHRPAFDAARIEALAARLVVQARQIVCGIRGHDVVLGFEPHHLSLRCMNCGWKSEGWRIDRRRVSCGKCADTPANSDLRRARLRA